MVLVGLLSLFDSTDTGRLFKAGNPNHLAEVLVDLIKSPPIYFVLLVLVNCWFVTILTFQHLSVDLK